MTTCCACGQFPERLLHVGQDEVDVGCWSPTQNPTIGRWQQQMGFGTPDETYVHVANQIENHVRGLGHTAVQWWPGLCKQAQCSFLALFQLACVFCGSACSTITSAFSALAHITVRTTVRESWYLATLYEYLVLRRCRSGRGHWQSLLRKTYRLLSV